EARQMIREPLAKGSLLRELGLDVLGQRFVVGQALDHILLELGQLTTLPGQQLRDVARAEPVEIAAANEPVGRQVGLFLADSLDDLRTHDIEPHNIARRYVPPTDATGLTALPRPSLVAGVSRLR